MDTYRRLLRPFRHLPFLPVSLLEHGFPRLACHPVVVLWGRGVGVALRRISGSCLLRTQENVYMPAATFASLLLTAGDVFVDVGASDGLISLVAASSVRPGGHVYSFEPNPVAFSRLQGIARCYRLSGMHLERCALGAEAGTAVLYVPECSSGATLAANAPVVSSGAVAERCDVQTLDTYWQLHELSQPPTVIKIDVEGAELDVLRGATNLLSSTAPPLVIFEASDVNAAAFGRSVDDVIGFLGEKGYRCFVLRYPELKRIMRAAEINLSGNPEWWTDVLAVNPTAPHRVGFELLRRRFRVVGDL